MSDSDWVLLLRERFNAGQRMKFILFWGHRPRTENIVDEACFSQWFASPFTVEKTKYSTAEHYMMAAKAKLFGDDTVYSQILEAGSPGAAKALGRHVRGFSDEVWNKHRFEIVCRATHAKFSQHDMLKDYLIQTGERVLVEASPTDRIWGIGLAANDEKAVNPNCWRGLNLLGFALMQIRRELQLGNR